MKLNKFFMLVDDDYDDAELFRDALSFIHPPVEFHHIEGGYEAFKFLDNLKNNKPDIIFLDLNMPEMSGWQCLDQLKKNYQLKHIPVIIYSTSSHQRDKEKADELGALGFLTKPSDFKILKMILYNIATSNQDRLKNTVKDMMRNYGTR